MCLLTNSLWQWVMALKPLFEFLHLLVKHWFRYHCDWLLIFLMIKTCWKIGFYAAFFNVDEMFFKIYFRSRETAFYDFIKFSWSRSHRKNTSQARRIQKYVRIAGVEKSLQIFELTRNEKACHVETINKFLCLPWDIQRRLAACKIS